MALWEDFFSGTLSVSLNSPVEMQDDNKEGLSVWLYRVVRDEQRVNAPPERINRTQVRRPPLPLRLHYLITPVLKNMGSASTETEQQILGKTLQVLHDHPVLFGADLQDVFVGTATELNVRLESLSLEETAHVREILKLDDPYELAVSYEVSVVYIESEQEPEDISPVQVVMPEYGLIVS